MSQNTTRLIVHVEGQTEENFVNDVLAPHLFALKFLSVSARIVGNARQRDRRGGILGWHSVKRDLVGHLKQDTQWIVTTMFDYYGLPDTWPGQAQNLKDSSLKKARMIEEAISKDIGKKMGKQFDARRFIPFVMVHEFEALLFSQCDSFCAAIGQQNLASSFQKIRDSFNNPEEIDDSPETAPSKRIKALFSGYQKPLHGPMAAREIGLDCISVQCPHFAGWLRRLEELPKIF